MHIRKETRGRKNRKKVTGISVIFVFRCPEEGRRTKVLTSLRIGGIPMYVRAGPEICGMNMTVNFGNGG